MQIETLKVFCDLVETKSFTRAAQINQITQSAVSQQISALEKQFNSLLIERSKKRFRLTLEGEVLFDYAKQMIQAYDSLQSKLEEIKDIVAGTIRVATIYSIGLHNLPPFITQFLKSFPTVKVDVEYRRADQVYEAVMGNTVDLGLVAYPGKDAKINIVDWRDDPLVMICHPNHPLATKEKIQLEDIAGQNFIAFEQDIPTRKAIDKLLRDRSIEVKNVMEFDNIETVKRAAEIDAGISIVPQGTVVQETTKQTLAQRNFSDASFARPLAVIHKKNKVLSPAMNQFIAILKSAPPSSPSLATPQREADLGSTPPN